MEAEIGVSGHKPRNADNHKVEKAGNESLLHFLWRKHTLLPLWFWTSGNPNWARTRFCCESHPVYGNLLQQPQETNTWGNVKLLSSAIALWFWAPWVFSKHSDWFLYSISQLLPRAICFFSEISHLILQTFIEHLLRARHCKMYAKSQR